VARTILAVLAWRGTSGRRCRSLSRDLLGKQDPAATDILSLTENRLLLIVPKRQPERSCFGGTITSIGRLRPMSFGRWVIPGRNNRRVRPRSPQALVERRPHNWRRYMRQHSPARRNLLSLPLAPFFRSRRKCSNDGGLQLFPVVMSAGRKIIGQKSPNRST